MHIQKIESYGLATDFNHDLEPLTIITGEPFSGKSTILNAVRAVILGHVPSLGKTNGATFEISVDKQMRLCARVNGENAARTWKRTASGASMSSDVPEWIEKEKFITLNTGEYFSLTPAERIRYLFTNTNITSTITPEMVQMSFEEPDSVESMDDGVRREAINKVAAALKGSVVDGIGALLDPKKGWVTQQAQYYTAREKDTIGAVRTMSELKARSQTIAEPLPVVVEKLKALEAKRAELLKKHAAIESRKQQVAELKEKLEQTSVSVQALAFHKAKLEESITLRDNIRKDWKAAADALKLLEKEIAVLVDAQNDARAVVTRCKSNVDLYSSKLTALQEEINSFADMAHCPTCRGRAKGWQERATEAVEAEMEPINEKSIEAQRALESAINEYDKTAEAHSQAHAKREAARKALDALTKKGTEISEKITGIQTSISNHETQIKSAEDLRKTLEASASNIEGKPEDLTDKIAELDRQIEEAQHERDAAAASNDELLRAEEAVSEHMAAAAAKEYFVALGKHLREQQGKIIDELFGSLLSEINEFTAGILKAPVAYHDGDLGYFHPKYKTFVSHRTMSGTESRVLHTATAVALANRQTFKLVILDEFDMDDPTLLLVMDRLSQFVQAGKVHQAIIARTTLPNDYHSSGSWLHIRTHRD